MTIKILNLLVFCYGFKKNNLSFDIELLKLSIFIYNQQRQNLLGFQNLIGLDLGNLKYLDATI